MTSSRSRIRVLVADDHPLYRSGVVRLLSQDPNLEVVAEAGTAESAVELAQLFQPDICLLDVSMPGDGLVAAKQILSAPNAPDVIMLTTAEQHDFVIKALTLGAMGYVLKGVDGDELLDIINDVIKGKPYVAPSLGARVLASLSDRDSASAEIAPSASSLTDRERQILQGVAKGLSNRDIGKTLDLSERTIKHYMTRLFQKLNVKNRVEAAIKAQEALLPG